MWQDYDYFSSKKNPKPIYVQSSDFYFGRQHFPFGQRQLKTWLENQQEGHRKMQEVLLFEFVRLLLVLNVLA